MEKQEIINEYEAAMFAANESGYAGMTAEQVIRNLVERAEAAEADSSYMGGGARYWHDEYCSQQHRLVAKVVALEAKLAEFEKQEPTAYAFDVPRFYGSNQLVTQLCAPKSEGSYPLFKRHVPAADLAELVPDEMPTSYIYHGGSGAFNAGKESGWNDCRSAILRKIEEAK